MSTTSKPQKKKALPVLTDGTNDKTMLPEVLPDPRRPRGAASPRGRTIAHMQRLLATATAAATAAASVAAVAGTGAAVAACGKTTKRPDESKGKSSGNPGEPPPPPTGYAVVDPMPPPAHCAGVAKMVRATAKFVKAGNDVVLVAHFPKPVGRSDYTYSGTAASVYGGEVLSTDAKPDAVTVTVKPEAGVRNVNITVKGNCDAGPSSVMATVIWAEGAVSERTAATIGLENMYDY